MRNKCVAIAVVTFISPPASP